jgi:hypothetical protein
MLVAAMAAVSFVSGVPGVPGVPGVGLARLGERFLITAQYTFGGGMFFDPVGLTRGMACGPRVIQRVPSFA